MKSAHALLLTALICLLPLSLQAEIKTYQLTLKNHTFSPKELKVPAQSKFKLQVLNQDPTPEEFESHDLNREKIVTGGGKITLLLGPLKPGKYEYFGEFNPDIAIGTIIAE